MVEHVRVRAVEAGEDHTSPVSMTVLMEDFARRINATWNKQVASVVERGRLLIEAKAALGHGGWLLLFDSRRQGCKRKGLLPFGERTAQYFMRIAAHPVLSNPQFAQHLPPCWSTLKDLAEIPEAKLLEYIERGEVNCEMKPADVRKLGLAHGDNIAMLRDFAKGLRDVMAVLAKYPDPAALLHALETEPEWTGYATVSWNYSVLADYFQRFHEAHVSWQTEQQRQFDAKIVALDAARQKGAGRGS